ncbi:hypothetical protein Y032_0774g2248 [Ancylostoma ceylanicum]|uniref:Uncharacterized protein n=1 Tax=Ancylostoma ceylanicum TaxID=53326 RepID=A0A016WCV4_9BILA|nr:hypothetical protein Y032_0774g2248 [Ancylostoma ceylanicum]
MRVKFDASAWNSTSFSRCLDAAEMETRFVRAAVATTGPGTFALHQEFSSLPFFCIVYRRVKFDAHQP